MDPASFLQGRTRETTIRRDAQGRWFQDGEALEHPNLTRAFDRWVDRAADGRYCLKNDINWAYVTLEGPPLFVRSVRLAAPGAVWLTLSDDREERLDPATLCEGQDGALYCRVRTGDFVARFDRHAMQQLEPVVREDAAGVFLALTSGHVRPPRVRDPLTDAPGVALRGTPGSAT
jgi:uncharacterized protein